LSAFGLRRDFEDFATIDWKNNTTPRRTPLGTYLSIGGEERKGLKETEELNIATGEESN
jgi:hypothetical protein